MRKRQWRMLMTEILEARNDAAAAHAYIENQVEALRQQLNRIEAQRAMKFPIPEDADEVEPWHWDPERQAFIGGPES